MALEGLSAIESPFGWLVLRWREAVVVGVECSSGRPQSASDQDAVYAKDAARELGMYFRNPVYRPHIPFLFAAGTPFQRKVWAALADIPTGEVRTYGALAHVLKSGPRAVGQACGRNPVPILVPCHRVVAAQGLGGYSAGDGSGLRIKQWLLQHEGAFPSAR